MYVLYILYKNILLLLVTNISNIDKPSNNKK